MNASSERMVGTEAMKLGMPRAKGIVIGFWVVTAPFCIQIAFTAYAHLNLPQVAEAFWHM